MIATLFILVSTLLVGLLIVVWIASEDRYISLRPPPFIEKRKNDEKHKNDEYSWPQYATYTDIEAAHEHERKMMNYRHQNEVIALELKQKEELMWWVETHTTPMFLIQPNDDYRKVEQ